MAEYDIYGYATDRLQVAFNFLNNSAPEVANSPKLKRDRGLLQSALKKLSAEVKQRSVQDSTLNALDSIANQVRSDAISEDGAFPSQRQGKFMQLGRCREISQEIVNKFRSVRHSDDLNAKDYICHALSDDYFTSMTVDEFRDFFNP